MESDLKGYIKHETPQLVRITRNWEGQKHKNTIPVVMGQFYKITHSVSAHFARYLQIGEF